jgi:hypothetical protein
MISPASIITKRSRALLTTTKGTGAFVVVLGFDGQLSHVMRLKLTC